MPRPTTITDAQILQAAREVFLEQGIRATTAAVARRARIAEGSIFNHFKTKGELFQAAMAPAILEPPFLRTLAARVGKGNLRTTLFKVALEMVGFFRTVMPVMMMSWSNPTPSGLPGLLAGPNPLPLRLLKRVAAFFEAEMRAARIRRHDPEIVARAYLAGAQSYVFFEMLLRAQDELPLPLETYLRGQIELLWNGLQVTEPPLKKTRPGRP